MTEPSYQSLLEECVAYHGHLCMGQCLGVRVAAAGLEYLGLPLLPASQRRYRDLIVVVENDRCIADAVAVVTGARRPSLPTSARANAIEARQLDTLGTVG